jgi:hypothetical protein
VEGRRGQQRTGTNGESETYDLGDDGTELAGSSRDSVGGGTVASREDLSGDDEGGGVGSEVLDCRSGRGVREVA